MKKINLILLSFLVLFQIEAFAYWDKDHWSERPNAPIVAILDDDIPGRDSSLLNMLSSQFKAKGMEVKHVNVATISDRDKFNVFNYDVLVLPNGSLNIIGTKKNIWNYLRYGGKLIVLGGPPFSNLCWNDSGKWVTMERLQDMVSSKDNKSVFEGFQDARVISRFKRETNDFKTPSNVRLISPGAEGSQSALEVNISNFAAWDQFIMPVERGVFRGDKIAMCFLAKGDKDTGLLSVEWREEDGSRWISSISLSTEWKHYILIPEDFRYWPDNRSKGRGYPGDKFNPLQAKNLSFGLAMDVTPMAKGEHKFWVDEISAVAVGDYGKLTKKEMKNPVYEGMSPRYKLYESKIMSIKNKNNQNIVNSFNMEGSFKGYFPVARPGGEGFIETRKYRWIPILAGYDAEGVNRCTPLSMTLDWRKYKGGEWVYFAIDDKSFYNNNRIASLISDVAVKMVSNPMILVAGAENHTYFDDEKIRVGAKIVNPTRKTSNINVSIQVLSGSAVEFSYSENSVLKPGKEIIILKNWKNNGKKGKFTVVTKLSKQGTLVDIVKQELNVVKVFPPLKVKDRIICKESEFYLGAENWHPVGLNYWPSYIAGQEKRDYRTHWLSPKFYDPVEIEKDIEVMDKMGINTVSIQYHDFVQSAPLVDFLRRLEKRNIKAHIFTGHTDPMSLSYSEKYFTRLIRSARLPDCPTVFSYDIAWEPNLMGLERRQELDADWNEWVLERYGSVKNAVKNWRYKPKLIKKSRLSVYSSIRERPHLMKLENFLTAPTDEQITNEGNWKIMVNAYRRFIDDEVSKRYNKTCTYIREDVDPNHLISARTGYGGNGMARPIYFAYDLFSGARHFDYISAEWYSLTNMKETVNGGFNTVYGKFVSRNKPVVWVEFGVSVWSQMNDGPSIDAVKASEKYYKNFINMTWQSGSQGILSWWFPGGYRTDEGSDFGVVNPDRTFRPSADVLTKSKAIFEKKREKPENYYEIKIDRDATTIGYTGVYHKYKSEYIKALQRGDEPKIVTEATGKTSQNVSMRSVGNKKYKKNTPHKYLNGEFNYLEYSVNLKKWKKVKKNSKIIVYPDEPMYLRCSVGNTNEAEWISPVGKNKTKGCVYILSTPDSNMEIEIPISKNTKYLEDDVTEPFKLFDSFKEPKLNITLTLSAKGRAVFGEKISFTIIPRAF